jgi:hypothetical protein
VPLISEEANATAMYADKVIQLGHWLYVIPHFAEALP